MAIIRFANGKKYDTVRRIFIDESIGEATPVPPPRPISRIRRREYSSNIWRRADNFIADIGDWISYNKDNFSERISVAFYFLVWIGLAVAVVLQWISSSFWSALILAVVGGVITYYTAMFGAVIFMFIVNILFFILRYIFHNIYSLLITIAIVLGICLYSPSDKPSEITTEISAPLILLPNYYCTANTALNVRERPYSSSRVLGQLTKNQKVYVYSMDQNNFAKIDFNGTIAYASSTYLKPIGVSDIISSNKENDNNINYNNILASIENIRVEHNVFEDEEKGMNIHVKFYTENMLNIRGECIAHFYYDSPNGARLKDKNDLYSDANRNVLVKREFTPLYENTTFKDFVLFMPYSELHLPGDKRNDLKTQITLWTYPPSKQPLKLTSSDWNYFWYGVQ